MSIQEKPRIRFSVIGLNHGHINAQVKATLKGGGEFVSFFAKEPELIAPFAKQFPQAKLARSEKEILEDRSIQLIVSASIPNERAPLGIEAMRHGKDLTWSQVVMAANTPMLLKAGLVEGNTDAGVLASGQVAGILDDLPSCAELVPAIVAEAVAHLQAAGAHIT